MAPPSFSVKLVVGYHYLIQVELDHVNCEEQSMTQQNWGTELVLVVMAMKRGSRVQY